MTSTSSKYFLLLWISLFKDIAFGQGNSAPGSDQSMNDLLRNLNGGGANSPGGPQGLGGLASLAGGNGPMPSGLGGLAGMMPVFPQVVTVSGGSMMLNCSSPFPNGHVSWFRPMDGMQVSHDNDVIISEKGRLVIRGDSRSGQFNLYIRNVKFPQDNGTWWCSIFNGPRIPMNLLVLVPPAKKVPKMSPISGIIFHVSSQAYTFSCTAHFAFPPVTLRWVKKSGPRMEYNPLPPTITLAPDFTISASSNLILSPMNHGSVFACEAEHPTFNGQVYSTDVQFIIADATFQPDPTGGMSIPSSKFGPGDVGLAVVSAILLVSLAILFFLMWLLRKRWQLDVRSTRDYIRVPTMEKYTTANGNAAHGHLSSNDSRKVEKKAFRRFLLKVLVGGSLLLIIIVMYSYLIPLYLKGYSIPITGVDEIVTVLAGGLLWLDCSSLAKRTDDLMVVGWRKEFYKFYNQYNNPILGNNFGFPLNITPETTERGGRTQNHGLGRVAVYPAIPGDQGLFICEVARIIDDQGHTNVDRKTFAVAVITDPPINTTLIAFVIVGLFAAILLAVLLMFHTLRRSLQYPQVDRENNTVETMSALNEVDDRTGPRSPSAPNPDEEESFDNNDEDTGSDRKVPLPT